MLRTLTPIFVLLLLVAATGCRSGAVAPRGWVAESGEPSPRFVSSLGDIAGEAIEDAPRLQVFIHYNRLYSTHTAVRLAMPGRPAVFWDPGGAYGRTKPSYGRANDIILDAPPDLPTWWRYRKRWLNEPFLLVFEWDLDVEQARTIRAALLDGAAHGRSAQEFQTRRSPGLCVFAVCDLLRTYGPPRISPKLRRNVLPNTLALQLWDQRPDRVLRYEGEVDTPPTVLTQILLDAPALRTADLAAGQ